MNANMAGIIKRIISEQGEAVLGDPQRLKGYVSDYAKNEPPAERLAFGRCIEHGAYRVLKSSADRAAAKAALARKVCDSEGLDIARCQSALDTLEAALFGAVSGGRPAVSPRAPVRRQYPSSTPPSAPPQYQPPQYQPPPYQQPQYRQAPAPKTGGTLKTLKILICIALGCYIIAVACNVVAINDLDESMIEKEGMSLAMELGSRLGMAQTLGIALDIMGSAAGTDYSSALLQNPRLLREIVNILFDWYAPIKWPPVLSVSKEIGWLVFKNNLSN
jgi:hypothetical protein